MSDDQVIDVIERAVDTIESRREPVNRVALAGLIITLALNMTALVWGAATLSATVNFLSQQVTTISSNVVRATAELNDIEARVRVLESTGGSE